jgi:hypothetical protein
MAGRLGDRAWNPSALVSVKCVCGYLHQMPRETVLEGLNVAHWKCAACKRRFVIACAPGENDAADQFWPIYLEDIPSTGTTVEDGLSLNELMARGSFQEVRFQCRCGCRLVGSKGMLGRPLRCPKCVSRIIVRAGPGAYSGIASPILEYLDGSPL